MHVQAWDLGRFGGGFLLLEWQTDQVPVGWRTWTLGEDDTDQRAGVGFCYYRKEFDYEDLWGENGAAPEMMVGRFGRQRIKVEVENYALVPVGLQLFVSR